jgi:hypothetical protein
VAIVIGAQSLIHSALVHLPSCSPGTGLHNRGNRCVQRQPWSRFSAFTSLEATEILAIASPRRGYCRPVFYATRILPARLMQPQA